MLRSVEAERVRNQLTKEDMAKRLGVSLKTYYNSLFGIVYPVNKGL